MCTRCIRRMIEGVSGVLGAYSNNQDAHDKDTKATLGVYAQGSRVASEMDRSCSTPAAAVSSSTSGDCPFIHTNISYD